MQEELQLNEQQINLLQQISDRLEDIKILVEQVYVKGNQSADLRDWITNKELEKVLGVTERTLATWRSNGSLNFAKMGKVLYYNKREIEQMLWNKFRTVKKLE